MRRRNNKYNAEEIHYQARIDPERLPDDIRDVPMTAAVDSVRELFSLLISRTTEGLNPTDRIRFCILADALDKPISTNMMFVSELTVEKLMSAVMKVLQSKDTIQLDAGFIVQVITIVNPIGAGKRKISNIALDRLEKKCILSIPTDEEGLCCAKAIVFAKAHLERDTTAINAMKRRDRPALMNRARKLHEDAGVPKGPCTFKEIAQFEDFLQMQIAVLSSENCNRVKFIPFLKFIFLCHFFFL